MFTLSIKEKTVKTVQLFVVIAILILNLQSETTLTAQNPPIIDQHNINRLIQLDVMNRGISAELGWIDDETIAVGGVAGVWIYDTRNTDEVHFYPTDSDVVVSMDYSPDYHLLGIGTGLTSEAFAQVIVWNTMNQERVLTKEIEASSIDQLFFEPSGNTIFAVLEDGHILRINISTGEVTQPHKTNATAALDLQGGRIALVDNKGVEIYDLVTNSLTRQIPVENVPRDLQYAEFSPDGRYLSAISPNEVQIWSIEETNDAGVVVPTEFPQAIFVEFHPFNDELLVVYPTRLAFFDMTRGVETRSLTIEKIAYDATFNSTGELLGILFEDGTVTTYSTATLIMQTELAGFAENNLLDDLQFTESLISSTWLSREVSTGSTYRSWNIDSSTEKSFTYSPGITIAKTTISADQSLVAFALYDVPEIHIYDVELDEIVRTLPITIENITSMIFSQDHRYLAIGSSFDGVVVWDIENGEQISQTDYTTDAFLAFVLDQNTIVFGDMYYWQFLKAEPIRLDTYQAGQISAFAANNDIMALATAVNNETTIIIWDLASFEVLVTIGSPENTSSIAISPDGNLLVAGSHSGSILAWDIHTAQLVAVMQAHPSLRGSDFGSIREIAFNTEGTLLATGSNDTTIRLWGIGNRMVNR